MKRSAGRFLIFIGTFTLALLPSLANAAPSTDELCERLYAEYLTKAQKALAEEKREDALRFLLEAQAVAQKCADSAERPLPQKQLRESDQRLPGTITNSVNSAAENDVELFGIDGLPRFQPIDNFLDLGLSHKPE